MRKLLTAALVIAACHGNDPATGGAGSAGSAPQTTPSTKSGPGSSAVGSDQPVAAGSGSGSSAPVADAAPPAAKPADPTPQAPIADGGHDFTAEGKALLAVGACGDVPAPDGFDKAALADHCEIIKKAQDDYAEKWVKPASEFFAAHVPKDVPKKVIYPFAGGDFSTALTVFPDADLITTMSLEPSGDPRTLDALKGKDLDHALKKVEYELKFLYRVNFSNTQNMIDAMRGGALPTELIFALSALKIHGYELVKLRYFSLDPDGTVKYLDDDDLKKAPDPTKAAAQKRNWLFANAEIQYKKPNGRVQVYRHIRANLGNEDSKGIGTGLKKDPRVVKYLEAMGPVAGMTKAASYLLSWESFSIMRDYLTSHVVWMVSDATGVAPKWGKPAGYDYETYGEFVGPHIPAGNGIAKDWRTEFESEPKRELSFRFGYYDKHNANHLIIIHKKT